MYVAVEGCGHGELDAIYEAVHRIETNKSIRISLLIICGDFQAVRNENDLQCMAVPQKYYTMGTFYKYYSGRQVAPVLTLVVGGNHEASNYMQQLAYGGWLAPRIYYIGYAGAVRFGRLRLAAQSGIYKQHDYQRGHHELPPYSPAGMRSAYHVRQLDTFRLKQLSGAIDVFISHDWPRGVYHHGNVQQLLKKKPFFKDEIASDQLGSPAGRELLACLRPSYWLAAHLHVKFAALVQHTHSPPHQSATGSGQVASGESERTVTAAAAPSLTRFLALDKCLPNKRYLQVLEFPDTTTAADESADVSLDADGQPCLGYDLEWLTVLRLTDHLLSVSPSAGFMPGADGATTGERHNFRPSAEELAATRAIWSGSSGESQSLAVPHNFAATVAAYDGRANIRSGHQPSAATNPQTTHFCARLGIRDPVAVLMASRSGPGSCIGEFNMTANNNNSSCYSPAHQLHTSAAFTSGSPLNISNKYNNSSMWSEPPSPAGALGGSPQLWSRDHSLNDSASGAVGAASCHGNASDATDGDHGDIDCGTGDGDDMFVIDRRGSLGGSRCSASGTPGRPDSTSLMTAPPFSSVAVRLTSTPHSIARSHTAARIRLQLPAPSCSQQQQQQLTPDPAGDMRPSVLQSPATASTPAATAAAADDDDDAVHIDDDCLAAAATATAAADADENGSTTTAAAAAAAVAVAPTAQEPPADYPLKRFKRRNHAIYSEEPSAAAAASADDAADGGH